MMDNFSKILTVSLDMENHNKHRTTAMIVADKEIKYSAINCGYIERTNILNSFVDKEAEELYKILIGSQTLEDVIKKHGGNYNEISN